MRWLGTVAFLAVPHLIVPSRIIALRTYLAFRAFVISFFPGGPGSVSTCMPSCSILRLSWPYAQ